MYSFKTSASKLTQDAIMVNSLNSVVSFEIMSTYDSISCGSILNEVKVFTSLCWTYWLHFNWSSEIARGKCHDREHRNIGVDVIRLIPKTISSQQRYAQTFVSSFSRASVFLHRDVKVARAIKFFRSFVLFRKWSIAWILFFIMLVSNSKSPFIISLLLNLNLS